MERSRAKNESLSETSFCAVFCFPVFAEADLPPRNSWYNDFTSTAFLQHCSCGSSPLIWLSEGGRITASRLVLHAIHEILLCCSHVQYHIIAHHLSVLHQKSTRGTRILEFKRSFFVKKANGLVITFTSPLQSLSSQSKRSLTQLTVSFIILKQFN